MSTRRRQLVPVVLLAIGVLAVALVAGPADKGLPLDPSSTGPLGSRALVEVLAGVGADVVVTDELAGADTALVLSARSLPDEATVTSWVEAGGVLVVADPRAPLAPRVVPPTSFVPVDALLPRDCDLPALADVGRVHAPGGLALRAPDGAQACFPRGNGHWLVAAPIGDGTVVALAEPDALLNRHLGRADNALLAVALLAPQPGARVVVLEPPPPGSGDATLAELLPDRVVLALVQFAVAFLLVAGWRARRLGAPVPEPQPVRLPGSALVLAAGRLLQQAGAREAAAARLRRATRRLLVDRLGLPDETDAEQVAAALAARTRADPDHVVAVLDGPPPADERALVRLAADLADLSAAADTRPSPADEGTVRV